MASNVPKKGNRTNELDALQKLSDGLGKHAAALQQVVIAGSSMTQGDVVAKLQARIAVAKYVKTTHAIWQNAVKADKDAAPQYKVFLSGVRQMILAAFAGQVDALADFGLTPRKVPVITPEKRAASALKAKATRAARGTTSKKQKAQIKPSVTITPATVTVNKPAGTTPPASPAPADHATPAIASPAQPAPAPASPSPAVASPPAVPASTAASTAASPAVPPATSPATATPAAHS